MSINGRGRRREPSAELPPGQSLVEDFPVLSAGPSGVGCSTGTTPDTIEQMASDATVSTRYGWPGLSWPGASGSAWWAGEEEGGHG